MNDDRGTEREAAPEAYSRRHSPAGWRTPREETPPGSAAAALGFTADTHAVAKATSIDVAAPAVAKPVAPAAVTTVVAPAARVHTNEELREQLAELTRGQLALQTQMQAQQSQLTGLLSTLNTIIFSSLPRNPPLLAIGTTPAEAVAKAAPVAKAGTTGTVAKATTSKAAPAPAGTRVLESPVTPSNAMSEGQLNPPQGGEPFSCTEEAPTSPAPAAGSAPQQPQLPMQDPTPQESVKARAPTPSRKLARNPSSEAPAPKHAKGTSEV